MNTVNPTETTPLAAQPNDTPSDQTSYFTATSNSDNEKPTPEEGEGDKAKDLTHSFMFFIALTSGLLAFLIFLPYPLWLEPYLFPNLINDNSPSPLTFPVTFGIVFFFVYVFYAFLVLLSLLSRPFVPKFLHSCDRVSGACLCVNLTNTLGLCIASTWRNTV